MKKLVYVYQNPSFPSLPLMQLDSVERNVPNHTLRQTKMTRTNNVKQTNAIRFSWNYDEMPPVSTKTLQNCPFSKESHQDYAGVAPAQCVQSPISIDLHSMNYRCLCAFHVCMAQD